MSLYRSYVGTSSAAVHYLDRVGDWAINYRRERWGLYLGRIRGGTAPHPLRHELASCQRADGRFRMNIGPARDPPPARAKVEVDGVCVDVRSGCVYVSGAGGILTPPERMAGVGMRRKEGGKRCYGPAKDAVNEALEKLVRNRFMGYWKMDWGMGCDARGWAGPTVAFSDVSVSFDPRSGTNVVSKGSKATSSISFPSEGSVKEEEERERERERKRAVSHSIFADRGKPFVLPAEQRGVGVGAAGADSASRARASSGVHLAAVAAARASVDAAASSTPPASLCTPSVSAPSNVGRKEGARAKEKELDAIWREISGFRAELGEVRVPASSRPFVAYGSALEDALNGLEMGLELGYALVCKSGSGKAGQGQGAEKEKEKHVPLAIGRRAGGDRGEDWVVGARGEKVGNGDLDRFLERYEGAGAGYMWTVSRDGKKVATVVCDLEYFRRTVEMGVVDIALKGLMKSLRQGGRTVMM
ncbi:hypothetical protein FA15DRAFT_709297 [Coprinopsis marcescibilis]|uniref:Uncharacterized protein n=1 Tax=Coprinopsis marcescibilis TaxID=230819 RepID=A0A5C3KGW1_COPMA|nr:hypothetical protein FA15DRAFT_709297 [Coprinopsis marcescibilis]